MLLVLDGVAFGVLVGVGLVFGVMLLLGVFDGDGVGVLVNVADGVQKGHKSLPFDVEGVLLTLGVAIGLGIDRATAFNAFRFLYKLLIDLNTYV